MKKLELKKIFEDVLEKNPKNSNSNKQIYYNPIFEKLLNLETQRGENLSLSRVYSFIPNSYGLGIIKLNQDYWMVLEENDLQDLDIRIVFETLIKKICKRHIIFRFRISEWLIDDERKQICPGRYLNIIPFNKVWPIDIDNENIEVENKILCPRCGKQLEINFDEWYEKNLEDFEIEYTCPICNMKKKSSEILKKLQQEEKI